MHADFLAKPTPSTAEALKDSAAPVVSTSSSRGAKPPRKAAVITVAVAAILAGVWVQLPLPLVWPFVLEVLAAVVASFVVSPLTSIVDVAVSKSASGDMTVSKALGTGTLEWIQMPLTRLRQPAFLLCWFVYLVTYSVIPTRLELTSLPAVIRCPLIETRRAGCQSDRALVYSPFSCLRRGTQAGRRDGGKHGCLRVQGATLLRSLVTAESMNADVHRVRACARVCVLGCAHRTAMWQGWG